MASKKRHGRARWIALGTILGVVAAWGGIGILGAAPSSITTCTKTSNNKMKIIPTSSVAKCTAKGKGTAATWVPQADLTTAQQYKSLLLAEKTGGAHDFHGMDLSNMWLAQAFYSGSSPVNWDMHGANLSDSFLYGPFFQYVNFTGANFSGVRMNNAYVVANDFSGANFTNADLRWAGNPSNWSSNTFGPTLPTFNNTTCPDGTNSDTHSFTCIGFGMN